MVVNGQYWLVLQARRGNFSACKNKTPIVYSPWPNMSLLRVLLVRLRSVAVPTVIAMLWIALAGPAHALRVCADPDYLPFSNRAGEGFENKIAEAVAKSLGETVTYTWASSRGNGGFPQFLAV